MAQTKRDKAKREKRKLRAKRKAARKRGDDVTAMRHAHALDPNVQQIIKLALAMENDIPPARSLCVSHPGFAFGQRCESCGFVGNKR